MIGGINRRKRNHTRHRSDERRSPLYQINSSYHVLPRDIHQYIMISGSDFYETWSISFQAGTWTYNTFWLCVHCRERIKSWQCILNDNKWKTRDKAGFYSAGCILGICWGEGSGRAPYECNECSNWITLICSTFAGDRNGAYILLLRVSIVTSAVTLVTIQAWFVYIHYYYRILLLNNHGLISGMRKGRVFVLPDAFTYQQTGLKKPSEFIGWWALPQSLGWDIPCIYMPPCSAVSSSVIPPHVESQWTCDGSTHCTEASRCD